MNYIPLAHRGDGAIETRPSATAPTLTPDPETWHTPSADWSSSEDYTRGMIEVDQSPLAPGLYSPTPTGVCDLCHARATRSSSSLLCKSCASAVSRVVKIAEWEANRPADTARNTAQRVILRAYLRFIHPLDGVSDSLIAEAQHEID